MLMVFAMSWAMIALANPAKHPKVILFLVDDMGW